MAQLKGPHNSSVHPPHWIRLNNEYDQQAADNHGYKGGWLECGNGETLVGKIQETAIRLEVETRRARRQQNTV